MSYRTAESIADSLDGLSAEGLIELAPQVTVWGRSGLRPHTEAKFNWRVELGATKNYCRLGLRLAQCDDLYRNRSDGLGLVQILRDGRTRLITRALELAPIVADRIAMTVTKEGKLVSELPKAEHLNAMLRSERFLSRFRAVDEVARSPYYLDDFSPVQSGYHDGGPGRRILYVGPQVEIGDSLETLHSFLDVMDFASEADKTNTVGAALTVLLRHRWPGEKPIVLVTASKSHSGKGTITEFLRGAVNKADILYENLDWPMQSQFHRQVKADPDIGVVVLDNVRVDSSGGRARFIRSAFIESFVTSAEVTLAAPGAGDALRLANKFVVVVNTNDGSLSTDLLNRCLAIHLDPRGSVLDRRPIIGNPKLEFIPRNRRQIESELRGMIERWRAVGCPLDETIVHSMSPWARVIGGILRHSGFMGFLANQGSRKAADEPSRRAIGLLGAARPGVALRPRDWARLVAEQGLTKTIVPTNEQDTEKGRERAIGVCLKPLVGETFEVETDTRRLKLRLEGGLRRWIRGKIPHVRYLFAVIREEAMPIDEDECLAEAPEGERDANAAAH
jgi:hypothetical protein